MVYHFCRKKKLIEFKLIDGVPINLTVGMPFFIVMYYISNNMDHPDLHDAYESYKLGMTDRETYLEQRKNYEQLLVRMRDNIEKQKLAVGKKAHVELSKVVGLEIMEGQMKLRKMNRKMWMFLWQRLLCTIERRLRWSGSLRMSLGMRKRAKFVVNDMEIHGRGWYN